MVGTREPPAEYDNDVMHLLKEHAKNKNNESRICQPDLKAWLEEQIDIKTQLSCGSAAMYCYWKQC